MNREKYFVFQASIIYNNKNDAIKIIDHKYYDLMVIPKAQLVYNQRYFLQCLVKPQVPLYRNFL